jgi:hypothetical protein
MKRHVHALAFVALCTLAFPPEVFARAGGGRHGGGGILSLILLPFLLIYAWYVNKRINEKKKLTEEAMARMAAKDPAWDEARLESFVRADFLRIENAWCEKDFPTLRQRLDNDLFNSWKEQLDSMTLEGHTNVLENLSLNQVRFVEAKDYPAKDRDEFTVCLDASATDYTVNNTGEIVDSNTASRRARAHKRKQQASFREFWTYRRKGQDWMLAAVDQSDQWSKSVNAPIAEQGGMKKCACCGKEYAEGTTTCPMDGTSLV